MDRGGYLCEAEAVKEPGIENADVFVSQLEFSDRDKPIYQTG